MVPTPFPSVPLLIPSLIGLATGSMPFEYLPMTIRKFPKVWYLLNMAPTTNLETQWKNSQMRKGTSLHNNKNDTI